jgi:hypothetical protein
MRYRLLAAFFAVCLAAAAETMSVDQLFAFVQSSAQFIKEGKMTDRELAAYLAKTTLTQRLDDRAIEEMQSAGVGPRTLEALRRLRDQSQSLGAAKPIAAPARPEQAPPPSSEQQGAILDEVRAYAGNYSRSLPDFICTQVTRRFGAPRPGTRYGGSLNSEPSWQLMDTLTTRLSYFEQKEEYKLVLVNNTATSQDYRSVGGSTVSGVFGSMMKDVFDRPTQARFEWDHWGTLRGRLAMVFAYHVDRSRSQWHITYSPGPGRDGLLDIVPAYRGLVYVDNKTHEVTRVTLEAEDMPATFPVKRAETILDYDYQDISGKVFLLPLKARTLLTADDYTTRNDDEFRMYRKYSVESELKFDAETPDALPEDQTRETPSPAKK